MTYPILDEGDRQWIESFRGRHDPQASRIDVHFTLVFPVDATPGELGPEVDAVAQSASPISFTIRGSRVVRDASETAPNWSVFLVPAEGSAQIATLHDRLYTGALKAHLRSDIPFIPHMTVAAAGDSRSAERLAEELDVRSRTVRGTITQIDLVDVSAPRVQSIATHALRNAVGWERR